MDLFFKPGDSVKINQENWVIAKNKHYENNGESYISNIKEFVEKVGIKYDENIFKLYSKREDLKFTVEDPHKFLLAKIEHGF